MSGLAFKVDVTGDALAAVQRLNVATQPARLLPVAGRAAVNAVRTNLLSINRTRPNALGGPRTEFYRRAANATSFRIVGDYAVVSIAQEGIAQRYFGGTIRPTGGKKFLTIPAAPEAHGKRASEFGDLEVVFGKGRQPIGLARREPGRAVGTILFRLVRSVTQRADPTVLPDDATMNAAVLSALQSSVERALRR